MQDASALGRLPLVGCLGLSGTLNPPIARAAALGFCGSHLGTNEIVILGGAHEQIRYSKDLRIDFMDLEHGNSLMQVAHSIVGLVPMGEFQSGKNILLGLGTLALLDAVAAEITSMLLPNQVLITVRSGDDMPAVLAKFAACKAAGKQVLCVSSPAMCAGFSAPDIYFGVVDGAQIGGMAQILQWIGRVGRGGVWGFVWVVRHMFGQRMLESLAQKPSSFVFADSDDGEVRAGLEQAFGPASSIAALERVANAPCYRAEFETTFCLVDADKVPRCKDDHSGLNKRVWCSKCVTAAAAEEEEEENHWALLDDLFPAAVVPPVVVVVVPSMTVTVLAPPPDGLTAENAAKRAGYAVANATLQGFFDQSRALDMCALCCTVQCPSQTSRSSVQCTMSLTLLYGDVPRICSLADCGIHRRLFCNHCFDNHRAATYSERLVHKTRTPNEILASVTDCALVVTGSDAHSRFNVCAFCLRQERDARHWCTGVVRSALFAMWFVPGNKTELQRRFPEVAGFGSFPEFFRWAVYDGPPGESLSHADRIMAMFVERLMELRAAYKGNVQMQRVLGFNVR